jgi:regulator of RNase E activity RraB
MKFTIVAALILVAGFSRFFGLAKTKDPDQLALQQLKKAGSNLSKPHKIEFFLYFKSQASAEAVAPTIKNSGFDVEVRQAAQGTDWLCLATKAMVPELVALKKIRRNFNAIAVANDGEYDGWGTGVVN